jgi:hypothetical protein
VSEAESMLRIECHVHVEDPPQDLLEAFDPSCHSRNEAHNSRVILKPRDPGRYLLGR